MLARDTQVVCVVLACYGRWWVLEARMSAVWRATVQAWERETMNDSFGSIILGFVTGFVVTFILLWVVYGRPW